MIRRILFTVLLLSLQGIPAQETFTRAQVLQDIDYLANTLEQTHYNLYAYTPKDAFKAVYKKVRASVTKDSLSPLEARKLFQRIAAAANNGHTELDFPVKDYISYAEEGGTLFPLELAFENNKALIRKNWSGNPQIKYGWEVLSINGVPIAELLSEIHPFVSAERPYFKNVKIELYSFPRYYWMVFGQQDDFEVVLRGNDSLHTFSLKAVDVIEGFEMKRTEILTPKRELKFYGRTAYLNPGNFSGDQQKYRRFIDSAFAEIKVRKSEELIVNIRNNGGGDDSFSDYLVAYFADKPFNWSSHFSLKTSAILKEYVRKNYDTTQTFWESVLAHEDGEVYDYSFDPIPPQPQKKRFSGPVFVLVNRQSHSQSAVTAAQIQDYQFATIVGEETGDFPSLYASVFQFTLPNTGIPVNVAKGQIVRVNGSTKKEGVIPDICIEDHLLDETDEILNGLLLQLDQHP